LEEKFFGKKGRSEMESNFCNRNV